MSGLSFWDIYFPIVAALITAVMLSEIGHFALNYYYAKKQAEKYLELQEKIKSGEIEIPPEILSQMEGSPFGGQMGMFPGMMAPTQSGPTTSGESPGQYL